MCNPFFNWKPTNAEVTGSYTAELLSRESTVIALSKRLFMVPPGTEAYNLLYRGSACFLESLEYIEDAVPDKPDTPGRLVCTNSW